MLLLLPAIVVAGALLHGDVQELLQRTIALARDNPGIPGEVLAKAALAGAGTSVEKRARPELDHLSQGCERSLVSGDRSGTFGMCSPGDNSIPP